jgi:hypothetical protein
MRDLTGQRFGLLTALRLDEKRCKPCYFYWLCSCDCGGETSVRSSTLLSGDTRSCGCMRRQRTAALNKERSKHSLSGTRAYNVWAKMISRCTDPSSKSFPDYGGRGITVCERWQNLEAFVADMGEPEPGMTLERIKNDLGYGPGNCCWATRRAQNNNTRRNVSITFGGLTMTRSQWEQRLGLAPTTLRARLRRGWSIERALTAERLRSVTLPRRQESI